MVRSAIVGFDDCPVVVDLLPLGVVEREADELALLGRERLVEPGDGRLGGGGAGRADVAGHGAGRRADDRGRRQGRRAQGLHEFATRHVGVGTCHGLPPRGRCATGETARSHGRPAVQH